MSTLDPRNLDLSSRLPNAVDDCLLSRRRDSLVILTKQVGSWDRFPRGARRGCMAGSQGMRFDVGKPVFLFIFWEIVVENFGGSGEDVRFLPQQISKRLGY